MNTPTQPTQSRNTAWAPYMVINPGETIPQAMERHRRDTGHCGMLILVAINKGAPPAARAGRLAAMAA